MDSPVWSIRTLWRAARAAGRARRPRERPARLRLGSYEFEKTGIARFDLRDPYHFAVTLTWPQFLGALLGLYLLANLIFATLFWLSPGAVANARPNSFADNFFFSVETLATVGYGEMYPATSFGRIIAASEIVSGLAFTAILTGLTFVRFSRPRAKLIFAANPVVAIYNRQPTLMLRIANARTTLLTNAAATLNILLTERIRGKVVHRAHELRLERAHIPAFPLSWTLMHVMDEHSPLSGFDRQRAIAAEMRIFVTIEARDPTLAATIQDIRNYAAADLRFGMRYADAVTATRDGALSVDLTRIGELEADRGGDYVEQGWAEHEEGWQ